MGILEQTQNSYYNDPSDFGNYQFTSLEDIINQFLVAYVGEEKIISKASRTDIAFHAQRAMQELSFDTFKSIKSQEIELPPSNTMILPHDYVNYTKLSWSDGAGIKHPLYPTKDTSNPFSIKQNTDGSYNFWGGFLEEQLSNSDFSEELNVGWQHSSVPGNPGVDNVVSSGGKLKFTHGSKSFNTGVFSRAYAVWRQIDVQGIDTIDLTATGSSAAGSASNPVKDAGVLRIGLTSSLVVNEWDPTLTSPNAGTTNSTTGMFTPNPSSRNHLTDIFDLPTSSGTGTPTTGFSYLEWNDGLETEDEKKMSDAGENGLIDVSGYDSVYLVITSYIPSFTTVVSTAGSGTSTTLESLNTIDTIKVEYEGEVPNLQSNGDSATWANYKSNTPNDNVNKYDDGTYDLVLGERYGIDPQYAQVNGSFYIDNLRGLIHFSSNISGKTVILDYISDSLGTDGEMQVHKFAEEAMYKWIMYAILSTRANIPENIVRRYKKEKFAATRQAKLRLSNIKLEELTQTLRGKSKHIKH
jgi:hypothetical protein